MYCYWTERHSTKYHINDLYKKLSHYGVRGSLLGWISNFGRSQEFVYAGFVWSPTRESVGTTVNFMLH